MTTIAASPILFPEQASTSAILSTKQWRRVADRMKLSDYELRIAQGVFDGRSAAEIGEAMDVPGDVVEQELNWLFRKLDISDRRELVICVFATYLALQRSAME